MIAKFYKNSSDNNTINKKIEFVKDLNIKIKDITEIDRPIILIKTTDIIKSNYVYIDVMKRFYFIEDYSFLPNGIMKLCLKCDVLETYKEQILKCKGIITRCNNGKNQYLSDDYETETRKECDIYKSNVTIQETNGIVLITIGG